MSRWSFWIALGWGSWTLSLTTGAEEILPGGFVAVAGETAKTTTPAPERPTQLRGRASAAILPRAGSVVELTVTAVRVGRYTDPTEVRVSDPAGRSLARASIAPGEERMLRLEGASSGELLTVECNSGQGAAALRAKGGRLLLPMGQGSLRLFRHANPLHFFVETGARSLHLTLAGQGDAETASATLRGPAGRDVCRVSTAEGGPVRTDIPVPPGADGGLWSVVVGPAERGIFEDASLTLSGDIGPYVAELPSDLVVPAARLAFPVLVRPEERASFRSRVFVAPSIVEKLTGARISMVDASGRAIVEREWSAPGTPLEPGDLPESGSYTVRLDARLGAARISAERSLFLTQPASGLGRNGIARVEGRPFFPRGLYHVQPRDYELVKEQGFNIVQASPGSIAACERAGLRAAVALYAGMNVRPDVYRKLLIEHRDSPAVACWMTMDEPAHHGVSLDLMAEAYAVIRETSGHPAYTCICRPEAYADYGRCTDIIAVDVYPVGKRPLTAIAEALDLAKRDAPARTVWFIGQVWSWPDTRFVTPREHRAMTYLALTHGHVRGLFWYSFRDPGWYLPESNPEVWKMCGRVNRELERLESVLLQPPRWERVEREGAGEAHCAARVEGEALWIIAVNPTDAATRLTLDLGADRVGVAAVEVFEERKLVLEDERLVDRLEPLDVKIYRTRLRAP